MSAAPLSRWQAAGIHLLISAAIALTVLAVLLALWYPPPLFDAAGGRGLFVLLACVDVVIGPLITLIVFRSGKPGLPFDLATIAFFQAAALAYGCQVAHQARPAFIVFVQDRFELATAADLEPAELARAKYPEFSKPPSGGPLLAATDWPADWAERQKLLEAALGGADLHHFPRYYVRYAEHRSEVLARAQPLARVRELEPQAARLIDEYLARNGRKESEVLYVPLRTRRAWIAVLIDAATAEPVKMFVVEKTALFQHGVEAPYARGGQKMLQGMAAHGAAARLEELAIGELEQLGGRVAGERVGDVAAVAVLPGQEQQRQRRREHRRELHPDPRRQVAGEAPPGDGGDREDHQGR